MSEETDALSNRIRQLESQVADMQRLVQDTSDLLDIARANGLDKFLTGHGLMEYGSGVMRLDSTGIHILTSATDAAAIYFGDRFTVNTGTPPVAYMVGQGLTSNGNGYARLQLISAASGANGAALDIFSRDTFSHYASLHAQYQGNVFGIQAYADGNNNGYVKVFSCPLWLSTSTSEPSTNLSDGMIWYRSDTDKFRARINGATENLATESYVVANAPTGFADAFLVMGG